MNQNTFSQSLKDLITKYYFIKVLISAIIFGLIIFFILYFLSRLIWNHSDTSFWESNLCQTVVLICTIITTIAISFWQVDASKKKDIRNAVFIVLLQIENIEENIENLSECIINGELQEKPFHYCPVIYEENQWDKYNHIIAGNISNDTFKTVDKFFKIANKIKEQQILIKQKLQQASEHRVYGYYNMIYNPARYFSSTNNINYNIENINKTNEEIRKLFDTITVTTYILKEYATGLEMRLKQYTKLTDGVAYSELKNLSD